jgi:predicted PhzF superfamily epimerase YddE/YHI9
MTPTERSLKYLREKGYLCAIVEKWNPHARIRQDLWGWCDILAIKKDEVLAVQVTSTGVAARITKIQNSETVGRVREAGIRIEVHGHRKNSKGEYVMRIEDIS